MTKNRFPLPDEIRILLISRNNANKTALESMLSFGSQKISLLSKSTISKGVKELSANDFDILLICGSINEEAQILNFIQELVKLPVVVIDKYYNKMLSDKLLAAGVQDYLDLSTLDSRLLLKSINFSIQQHKIAFQAKNAHRRMELRSSFLTNMSHEIRTPLNSIIGFSELLFDDETDAVKREKLNMIRQSGKHLLTLINSILDFSKLEAGKIAIEESEFSLDSLIQNLYYMMLVKSGNKNIDLNIKPIGEIPYLVSGDKFRLNQVLINLMNNAIKFTDKGSVTLEYSFEKDCSIISIIDTGIGIPSDKINHIFNAFEQVSTPLTSSQTGTGLGLAISKSLVNLMKGTIDVESTPQSGSRFTVTIPLKVINWHSRNSDLFLKNLHPERKLAVLYKDDNILSIMQKWCSQRGFKAEFSKLESTVIENRIYDSDLILIPQETYRTSYSELYELLRYDSRSIYKPKVLYTSRNKRLFFLIPKNSFKTQLIDIPSKLLDKNFSCEEFINFTNETFENLEIKGKKLVEKWKKSFEQENPGLEGILNEAISRFFLRQQELNIALQNHEYKGIEDIAHSLKGFTGQTCMYEVSNRASILLDEMRKQQESPHPEVIKREISALNEIIWLIPAIYHNHEIDEIKSVNDNDAKINLKILVAEDNPINQAVINDYLKYFNQDCEIVSNGKEVLQKLAESKFDLLLLDLQMPVMNGVETLKEIRSNPDLDSLFITIISAFLAEDANLEYTNKNANAFLSKPFEKKDIKIILDKAFNYIEKGKVHEKKS